MSDRDLSLLFTPKSAPVVGAGERATSSGGRLWRTRGARQSQGRHDIRLRIGDLDCRYRPPLPSFCARGCRRKPRSPTDARENRFGLAFEAAIEGARSDNLSDVRFRDRRGT
jgi:hypothetical protein